MLLPFQPFRFGNQIRKPNPWRRRLCVERLEDRTLLSNAPVLVKDINTTAERALNSPTQFISFNGLTYFGANDGIDGYQLWQSDGTTSGTVMVTDIAPSTVENGAQYGFNPRDLTVINGTLFMSADGGSGNRSVWKSDGTAAGTVEVKNFDSDNHGAGPASPHYFFNVNGTLFFIEGGTLWKSDGTTAGTVTVSAPSLQLSENHYTIANVNGTLFFSALDNVLGGGLWKSDGTTAGTVQVDVNATSPQNLTNVNGTLFFTALDGSFRTLWTSDGTTAGTVVVKDINPNGGAFSSQFSFVPLTNLSGTVYFQATDGTTGFELWKSDGTAAGTVLVTDINPGSGNSYAADITVFQNQVFFRANDGTTGSELWKSDGTSAGTVLVKDINTGKNSSYPSYLTDANGTLFFQAGDKTHGSELWKSDGTTAGTVLVKDALPGAKSSAPQFLAYVNGTLFYAASDDGSGGDLEPWKSDGTAAGTVELKHINFDTQDSMNAFERSNKVDAVGGTVYFAANDGTHGDELWKSDGTAAGTVLVRDIARNGGSYPLSITNVNGTVFFVTHNANVSKGHWVLWKTDGTSKGTISLHDFGNSGDLANLNAVGSTLVFAATDTAHGRELWRSDGTTKGTTLLKDINPGSASAYLNQFSVINGVLYFSADDGTHGSEPWKSDGTSAGTVMIADINPGAGNSQPGYFVPFLGEVYFVAADSTDNFQLWKTDGTTAGTVLAVDLVPSEYPTQLTPVGGTLFFVGNDHTNGQELWKSDGTAAGTALVVDLYPGANSYGTPYSSGPNDLTNLNGTLLFAANGNGNGYTLWKSDGTAAGTVMLANVNPTPSVLGGPFTVVGNLAYFIANDGVNGTELWSSDGTVAGTGLVSDLNPGAAGSNPANLLNANGTLFFAATDGIHGYELFEVPPPAASAAVGEAVLPASRAAGPSSIVVNALLPAASTPALATASPPSIARKAVAAPLAPPVLSLAAKAADQIFAALPHRGDTTADGLFAWSSLTNAS